MPKDYDDEWRPAHEDRDDWSLDDSPLSSEEEVDGEDDLYDEEFDDSDDSEQDYEREDDVEDEVVDNELTEEDDWEELERVQTPARPAWPIGLIIVAVVALLLLTAGGYGVIKQRAAMETEIRELQIALANKPIAEALNLDNTALAQAQRRNGELETALAELGAENRLLNNTVAGLEQQLADQSTATAAVAAKSASSTPAPAASKSKTLAATPTKSSTNSTASGSSSPATASSGDWFVNFASYSQRDTAQQWADKLRPSKGKTQVTATPRGNSTLYRVRVIGLQNKGDAETVAGQLAKEYKLPKLWVGEQ